jgi:regulator of cell morphogenesis and NO signaling
MLDPNLTVTRTVLDHSECAPVFQRHRIDYCCKGDRSISAACQERGLDLQGVLSELETAISSRVDGGGTEPATMSTPSLVAHIVSKHHDYLRKTLPFVRGLAEKVARVHGDHNPRLRDLDALVTSLADTLEPHLDHEEQVLFPTLVARGGASPAVAIELATMHADHLLVGETLARMREAAEDYQLPEWACTSYRTLFAELARIEDDTFRHVHLENNVLMPRFVS